MQLQLAWRNIWRNPRRTLTILAAVIVGVWSMIFMGAISRGMGESMLVNALKSMTGHIQIQTPPFRDDPVIEHHLTTTPEIRTSLEQLFGPEVLWAERVQVFGVVSNARHSRGITIVGIDPEREPGLSFYGDAFSQGAGLEPGDDFGIVIGQALADTFDTDLERKLVLMSQHLDKSMSSRAFRIRGLYSAEMEATEKQFVFITIQAAREMLGLGDQATNVAVLLPQRDQVDTVVEKLAPLLPDEARAYSWRDLLPMLTGYLEMFDSFLYLWYGVTFVAMAFGITNTTLMAVLERIREYGLLKALGMRPRAIIKGVLLECAILLAIGVAIGDLLGVVSVLGLASSGIDLSSFSQGSEYVGMGRVMYPVLEIKDFVAADMIVLVLGVVVSLYPALKAGRITPVEAMAHT